MADILYIVVPCYNEEEVLPETSRRLRAKLEGPDGRRAKSRSGAGCCLSTTAPGTGPGSSSSRLHGECPLFCGVDLSRNRGHQNALLAGLMTAKERCDMAISMDADLQDDIDAVDAMVEQVLRRAATWSTACAPPGKRTPSSSASPPRAFTG